MKDGDVKSQSKGRYHRNGKHKADSVPIFCMNNKGMLRKRKIGMGSRALETDQILSKDSAELTTRTVHTIAVIHNNHCHDSSYEANKDADATKDELRFLLFVGQISMRKGKKRQHKTRNNLRSPDQP